MINRGVEAEVKVGRSLDPTESMKEVMYDFRMICVLDA